MQKNRELEGSLVPSQSCDVAYSPLFVPIVFGTIYCPISPVEGAAQEMASSIR
jgi:hypothetical protein